MGRRGLEAMADRPPGSHVLRLLLGPHDLPEVRVGPGKRRGRLDRERVSTRLSTMHSPARGSDEARPLARRRRGLLRHRRPRGPRRRNGWRWAAPEENSWSPVPGRVCCCAYRGFSRTCGSCVLQPRKSRRTLSSMADDPSSSRGRCGGGFPVRYVGQSMACKPERGLPDRASRHRTGSSAKGGDDRVDRSNAGGGYRGADLGAMSSRSSHTRGGRGRRRQRWKAVKAIPRGLVGRKRGIGPISHTVRRSLPAPRASPVQAAVEGPPRRGLVSCGVPSPARSAFAGARAGGWVRGLTTRAGGGGGAPAVLLVGSGVAPGAGAGRRRRSGRRLGSRRRRGSGVAGFGFGVALGVDGFGVAAAGRAGVGAARSG